MAENLDEEELEELRWKQHAQERQEIRQKRQQQRLLKQRIKMASIAVLLSSLLFQLF